jgi:nucleoside-diphosphate kinase
MERTLMIIKPDAVSKNLIGEVIRRVENSGYRIVNIAMKQLNQEEAEAFYHVHEGEPFYDGLIQFMMSGPCIPMVIEGEGAVQGVRELVGSTDPKEAASGTIRSDYAETVRRNVVHASDSEETAVREIAFFFDHLPAVWDTE